VDALLREELEGRWEATRQLTLQELESLVALAELGIDLLRTGFTTIQGSEIKDDADRLEVMLLNMMASSLEGGYRLALSGHYQQAAACARMMLEALANIMFIIRKPEHATRALADSNFRIGIRDELALHPIPATASWLVCAYDELSAATHPRQLSLFLGQMGGKLRISAYAPNIARISLFYLAQLALCGTQILRPRITDSRINIAWLNLEETYREQLTTWTATVMEQSDSI
jgi:hypothetical protein